MALNWIKWVKGLSRRREVLAVAQALGLDRRIVACACMEVWEWADDNTTTGLVNNLTAPDIDLLVGITGFGSALCTVGWLTVRTDGIQFPRWDRHNSQSAKERSQSALRQKRKRERDATVTSRNDRNSSVTRSEKSRGEENGNDVLGNLTSEELKSAPALLARYRRVVAAGMWPDAEADRHKFFALAELAMTKPKPLGFFRTAVETKDCRGIHAVHEDRASAKLKSLNGTPSQFAAALADRMKST